MYITMLLVLFVRLVAAQTRRSRGAGLMALDDAEHPDPGFRLCRLPGERRATGISARDGSRLGAVHVHHAAGKQLTVGIVIHRLSSKEASERDIRPPGSRRSGSES